VLEASPMSLIAFDTAAAFFGAAVLLALAPGPDNLFVLMQSAMRGRAAGLFVVLGLCSGLLVHTSAVALGLATLFATSTLAFTLLKAVGALYLVWLAWQAWHAPASDAGAVSGAAPGAWQLYRRGIVMNVTNPKVTIFFLAFLPQFVVAGRGRVGEQVLALGAIFMVATLLVFGAIALTGGTLRALLLRSPRAQVAMNRIAAVVFVGLAARLALVRN
jgi:threonine/homoserine/homoserine lactone efflux protein